MGRKKEKSEKLAAKELVPNPGSDEALYDGCTCPVMDNAHGQGWFVDGKHQFWRDQDCPLHNPEKKREVNDDKN